MPCSILFMASTLRCDSLGLKDIGRHPKISRSFIETLKKFLAQKALCGLCRN